VDVLVEQEHRTVGHDRVEVLLARQTAGEALHRPAATDDPRLVGVRRGVGRDDVEIGLLAQHVVEPHPQPVAARERCVDVAVLEAGQQQPTRRAHHPGARPGEGQQVVALADGGDPVTSDGQPRGPATTGQPDPCVGDDEVGSTGRQGQIAGHRAQPPLDVVATAARAGRIVRRG